MAQNRLAAAAFIILIGWTILSATLLSGYLIFAEWIWQGWYYLIWPIGAGGIIWRYRNQIKPTLANWRIPPILKYVLLVYAMVLLEEILAATLNHLPEGYSASLHLKRITQFWALNILAFSGMAWGSYLIFARYQFTRIQMFCVMGAYGQISEHLLSRLLNPAEAIAAFTLIPLTFWTYGIIFLPAIFIIEDAPRNSLKSFHFPLAVGVIFLTSIPFIVTLDFTRSAYPDLFPPHHMIR